MKKGAAAEREVQAVLEASGWFVHRVKYYKQQRGKRCVWQQDDIFGFGDLFAMKAGEVPRMIQVTDGGDLSHRVKRMKAVVWHGVRPQIWYRKDRPEWQLVDGDFERAS